MNRYPLWKYILVAVALVFGFIYTLPNFYGESPAVQVSSAKVTLKIDEGTRARVESALQAASITHDGIQLDTVGVKARFKDTDTQLKAKDVLERAFNPDPTDPQYVIALNLLSASPQWLTSLHALPMYSASICAAACTSSCKSTCRAPSPNVSTRPPPTCAACYVTRMCATPGSAATANGS